MNAETLVETTNRAGQKQVAGTKVKLSAEVLKSYIERGIVKELKGKPRTKQLKMGGVLTKTQV
ncbi:hypothetical protein [Emticicia sp. C21]|uniref:hypothetical protein n=1 Tax=Emticicia sp. C21 TaxID=2302915 RepID=UPI000E345212|nr:hypothetical protein [Emticicia sp. C21]RFS17006.1 hypothetical protein D0T08_10030 [Emticicia sp. C21]